MKQISIENIKDGRKFSCSFNDDVKQQAWIDLCVANNSWGLAERIVDKEPVDYDLADVIEEIPEVVDENGNVIEVAKVKLKCQYVITITDLTTDPDYLLEKELRKAQCRLQTCQFVMQRVAARNRLVQMTEQETALFLQAYEPIIKLLQVGELAMARTAIAALEPVGGITAEEIALIVSICDDGLAKEGAIE